MDQAAYDSLTPKERECLHRVSAGLTTDEIAREFGRSSETVKTHIDSARAKLGGVTRRQAARLITAFEAPPLSRGTPPKGIEQTSDPVLPVAISQPAGDGDRGSTLREERATFGFAELDRPLSPPPAAPGERRDVTRLSRFGWTAVIAVALALLLIALQGMMSSFTWAAEVVRSFYR